MSSSPPEGAAVKPVLSSADWQVLLHPHNPTLVTLREFAGEALINEHLCRWRGQAQGWDPSYWVPRHPLVPMELLRSLEALLG